MKQNRIPASEGWQQMKLLLEKELPADNNNKNNKKKYSVLLLLLLISSCGVYKYLTTNTNQNNTAIIEVANNKITNNKTQDASTENVNKEAEKQIETETKATTNTELNENKIVENFNKNNAFKNSVSNKNDFENQKVVVSSLQKNDAEQKVNKTKPRQQKLKQKAPLTQSNITKNTAQTIYNIVAVNDDLKNSVSKQNSNDINNATATNQNSLSTTQQNNSTISKNSVTKTSSSTQQTNTNTNTTPISKVNKKENNQPIKLNYGLDFSFPVSPTNNLAKAYATNQWYQTLLPSVWVSKNISTKSTIKISFNPNSQYILNSNSYLDKSITTSSQSASGSTNSSNQINQTTNLLKLTGFAANAEYQYQISSKLKLGFGIQTTFNQNAIFEEVVVKNKEVVKENFYSKTIDDFNNISKTFFSLNSSIEYQIKKHNIGLRVIQPLSKIVENTTGINTVPNVQLFYSLKLK